MYPILPIRGSARYVEQAGFPRTLPVRPVRGIKRYAEHLDYQRDNLLRRSRQQEEHGGDGKAPHRDFAFPYAKEAEVDSAADFAKAVAGVLTAAAGLKRVLVEFHEPGGSVLQKRTVLSSAPEAVAAQALPGALPGTCRITVRRLASAQLNRTAYYAPNAPTTVEYGFNRLRLRYGEESRELEMLVLSGDTHRSVLTRLRNIWNEQGAGVRAALETDSGTGRLRLALEGASTGASHAFALEDMAGNLATVTGLLVTDRTASDAELRVGSGPWLAFPGNRIRLTREGLDLELLGELPPGTVELTVKPDTDAISAKMRELSSRIRILKSKLDEAPDYINPALARSLGDGNPEETLERLADQVSDHYQETVEQLTAPGGIPARLRLLLARVEGSPAEELLNRGHTRYKRYANYMASLDWYSQLPSRGLLLNRFF